MTTATARRNPLASREHETMTLASGNDNKMLAIAQIRRDGQTQPRQGMNEDVVTDYVAALADNVRFPAVDVMFDGVNYWLFDGFHRVESHLRSGRTEIEVKIHYGTLEQAQWRSYAANQSHGLRRSTADKERAIRAALQHKAAQGMSDNALAKHLGVSDKTVTKYRVEMQSASEIPKLSSRTGIDGKTYDTTNIGKRATYQPWALPFPAEPTVVRTLSLDETIAVVFRVLKHENPHISDPNAHLTWLNKHSQMRDYEHSLASGVKMGLATFCTAWASVAEEQREAIDSQKRAEAAAAPAVTPRPSVAGQVIDLAEQGMDAEIGELIFVQPGGKRRVGLESMLALYASVLDSCEEFGKLTGRHTMTVSLCRAIEPMIAELRKNLA